MFEPSRIYRIEKIYQLGSISREGFGQTCLSTFRICTVQFSLVVMNHRCSSGYSSFNSWFDFNPLSLSLSANSTVLSPLTYRPFPFLSTYLETCTYPQMRFSLSSKYNKVARVRRFRRPFSLLYKPCSNKRTPTSKENGGFRSCVGRDDSFFNFIGSCHVIKWTGPVR